MRGATNVLDHAKVALELHPSAWSWSGHSRQDLERVLDENGLKAVGLSNQADVLTDYGHAYLARRL